MSKSKHLWSLGFLLKNAVNCRLSNEEGFGKDRRHLEKTRTLASQIDLHVQPVLPPVIFPQALYKAQS
jgi:hypothetical protein